MELKVWVEGIQRIVCGVTEKTSCQDVVYALAYATGKTGRFTLIERWRNNERLLAPHEHPLKVLMKWGEYSNDVQFILQRSSQESAKSPSKYGKQLDSNQGYSPSFDPINNKEGRKSATPDFSFRDGAKRKDNVGIVKGIPQRPPDSSTNTDSDSCKSSKDHFSDDSLGPYVAIQNAQNYSNLDASQHPNGIPGSNYDNQETMQLKNFPLPRVVPRTRGDGKDKNVLPLPPYREPPSLNVVSKTKELPPYRDPPPAPLSHHGRTFSYLQSVQASATSVPNNQNLTSTPPNEHLKLNRRTESHGAEVKSNLHLVDSQKKNKEDQWKDLIDVVNQQRDKINSQNSEISMYNNEIKFWENKSHQNQNETESLFSETSKLEKLGRHAEEELRYFQSLEDEQDLTKQKEKTLQSEITLLKTKLVNCETQIIQCKNKIRLLADEVDEEKNLLRMNEIEFQEKEAFMLSEITNLKSKLDSAMKEYDSLQEIFGDLDEKTNGIDATIMAKKKEVENLVNEMKRVNLESLNISPPDELKKQSIEGLKHLRPRKIIGSPRQLETAVPTAKNPHGVWV